MATIELGELRAEHVVGDRDCSVGWCGDETFGYPREHEGCGGLIHAEFGDEDEDCSYWLYRQCDRCGDRDF